MRKQRIAHKVYATIVRVAIANHEKSRSAMWRVKGRSITRKIASVGCCATDIVVSYTVLTSPYTRGIHLSDHLSDHRIELDGLYTFRCVASSNSSNSNATGTGRTGFSN